MTISELCTACDSVGATTAVQIWDNAEHFHVCREPKYVEWLMRLPTSIATADVERFRMQEDGLIDVLVSSKLREEEICKRSHI